MSEIEEVDLEQKQQKRHKFSQIKKQTHHFKNNKFNRYQNKQKNNQSQINSFKKNSQNRKLNHNNKKQRIYQKESNQDIETRPKPNVIIQGFPEGMTDQQLMEMCSTYGPLDLCLLVRDNFGQIKPEGIGLIAFEKLSDAEKCVEELNEKTIISNDKKLILSAKVVGQATQTTEIRGNIKIVSKSLQKNNNN